MKFTKILSLILVLVTVLSLCACGGGVDMSAWDTSDALLSKLPLPEAGKASQPEGFVNSERVSYIEVTKVSEEDYNAYIALLQNNGWSVEQSILTINRLHKDGMCADMVYVADKSMYRVTLNAACPGHV